jgi:hypothetical protein
MNVKDNKILSSKPINFFNPDKTLSFTANQVKWNALTTGNFGGFDVNLESAEDGTIEINTPLVNETIKINNIGFEDKIFDNSGVLPKFLKIFRLPTNNEANKIKISRKISLSPKGDNPIFIRITQEDGTQAWTSPIYVYR